MRSSRMKIWKKENKPQFKKKKKKTKPGFKIITKAIKEQSEYFLKLRT